MPVPVTIDDPHEKGRPSKQESRPTFFMRTESLEAPDQRCRERTWCADIHEFARGGQTGRSRADIDFVQEIDDVDLNERLVEVLVEVAKRQAGIEIGHRISRQFDSVDVVQEARTGALDLHAQFERSKISLCASAQSVPRGACFTLSSRRSESILASLDVFIDFRLQVRAENIK